MNMHQNTEAPRIAARSVPLGSFVHVKGEGRAVFEIAGKTFYAPPDSVRVRMVSDPHGDCLKPEKDLAGWETVQVING